MPVLDFTFSQGKNIKIMIAIFYAKARMSTGKGQRYK